MRKKVLVSLVSLIVLPLAILLAVSFYLLQQDKLNRQYQIQSLIQAQLQGIESNLLQYFAAMETKLLSESAQLSADTEELRDFVRKQPLLRAMLVLDEKGQRLFPPMGQRLLSEEIAFLERSKDIWQDRSILFQLEKDELGQQMIQGRLGEDNNRFGPQKIKFPDSSPNMESSSVAKEPAPAPQSHNNLSYGWYTWFWGKEMNLLFWVKAQDGKLYGFELNPMRMLADLIAVLPDSKSENALTYHIQLVDARNTILYQWGKFMSTENATPLAIYPLDHPLGAWKLTYFADNLTTDSLLSWWNVVITLFIVAAILVAFAVLIYREQTRQQRLAQTRVNFVNQVSHELKTPLTNIRLYAELLADDIERNEAENAAENKAKQFSHIIASESQRLSRLIHNVLDFSRIEKRTINIKPRSCDVVAIIENVIANYQPALTAKSVTINFKHDLPQQILIDPDVLEQIMNNLLSNVEKYGFSGGHAEISASINAEKLMVVVKDDGPGIPKAEREKIFQPFYRVSSKLTDGVSGTGIGLDIARALARLHGGDVNILPSEKGAVFQVTLSIMDNKTNPDLSS